LPRRVVAVGQAERFGDVALALESFALHRRQLALDERAPCRLDPCALLAVERVRELDRRALVLDLAAVGGPHDGLALPRDLALVERRELAVALRLDLPVEQHPRRTPLVAPLGTARERLARQLERILAQDGAMGVIDG